MGKRRSREGRLLTPQRPRLFLPHRIEPALASCTPNEFGGRADVPTIGSNAEWARRTREGVNFPGLSGRSHGRRRAAIHRRASGNCVCRQRQPAGIPIRPRLVDQPSGGTDGNKTRAPDWISHRSGARRSDRPSRLSYYRGPRTASGTREAPRHRCCQRLVHRRGCPSHGDRHPGRPLPRLELNHTLRMLTKCEQYRDVVARVGAVMASEVRPAVDSEVACWSTRQDAVLG
jgi:hypothetical protein